jgi:mRNA-degrading endonuclease RelE of RelBE toxin-antitoxin system
MSYNIQATPQFSRELKKLTKKYISLKPEFLALLESLKNNPTQGNSLGNDTYKIRLAIQSKSSGKRGGARVITFVRLVESEIILLGIYDKSTQESITIKEINERIKNFLP